MKIGAVVLAAGGSTRLGQPKQLLVFEGQLLVHRIATAALEAGCDPVVVVVGAKKEKVVAALRGLAVKIVPNESWEQGMGTSIRTGAPQLQECDALLILACDQLAVDAGLLRRIIARHEQTKKPMVASAYAGTVGVPALFARSCFELLYSLGEKAGAKALLTARPGDVASVAFPEGAIDVDTPADLRTLGG